MSRENPNTTHDNAGIAANVDVQTWQGREFQSFEDCRDAFFAANGPEAGRVEWREGFGIRDLVIASNIYLRTISWRVAAGIPTAYAIVLYKTEVVRYYEDGTFSVDNGGHNTPTTSRRVTQFTPDDYHANHERKRLRLNGRETGHDRRFPVSR